MDKKRHINKYFFTKHIFEKTVREALKSVTLQRPRRFLRKAYDYKRAYRSLMVGAGPDALRSCASSLRRTAVLLTWATCLLRALNLLVLSMLV